MLVFKGGFNTKINDKLELPGLSLPPHIRRLPGTPRRMRSCLIRIFRKSSGVMRSAFLADDRFDIENPATPNSCFSFFFQMFTEACWNRVESIIIKRYVVADAEMPWIHDKVQNRKVDIAHAPLFFCNHNAKTDARSICSFRRNRHRFRRSRRRHLHPFLKS